MKRALLASLLIGCSDPASGPIAPDSTPDTAVDEPDTGQPDTTLPDTTPRDTSMPDTSARDTAVADSAAPDTAMDTRDTAPPLVCTASSPFCVGERVMECADGGLAERLVIDCASSAKVCVAGACAPVVCTASARYCAGRELRQCSAKGDSFTIAATCTSSEYCDGAASPATCRTMVCTPSAPSCDGSTVRTCNGEGSGFTTGGTDCSSSMKVCSAGACVTPICTAGASSCKDGKVVRCNSDSLTTTVVATCTSSEYCDTATATCKPLFCPPGATVCSGTVKKTCNSSGTAFESGGTDCAPDYCSAGACTYADFFEDWEDGDYAGWFLPAISGVTRTITTTGGAEGTPRALCISRTSGSSSSSGVSYTFPELPPVRPNYIAWWARAGTTYSNFVQLGGDASSGSPMVWQAYVAPGNIVLNRLAGDILVPHPVGSWYFTELRNVDWTTRTFDYWVNGTLRGSAIAFERFGGRVGILEFFQPAGGSSGCIDQIIMK